MKKIVLYGIVTLALVTFVYSFTSTYNLFDGLVNATSVFDDSNFSIHNISVNKNFFITDINMNISGTPYHHLACYQESANKSTSCGGLSSGEYGYKSGVWAYHSSRCWDENYSSFCGPSDPSNHVWLYMNYTKPKDIGGLIWQVKDQNGTANITINTANHAKCFNANPTKMIFEIYLTTIPAQGKKVVSSCYNGTEFVGLKNTSGGSIVFYEESVFWELDTYPSNITFYSEGHIIYNNISEINSTVRNIKVTNTSPFNDCLSKCTNPSGYDCICNLNITSKTKGNLTLSNLNVTASYSLDNCQDNIGIDSNATTVNIIWLDLDDISTNINHSTNIDYTAEGITGTFNFSYNETGVNTTELCIYPSWANFSGDFLMQYLYEDSILSFITSGTRLDNTTLEQTLYVDTGTEVTATVYDNTNNRLEGALIQVQRYDISTNTFKTVGSFQTNSQGEAKLVLTLNSVYYRFLIFSPINTLRLTTTSQLIFSNALTFQISTIEEVAEDFYNAAAVTYTLDYINSSKTFRYIFSDTGGNIEEGCLKVWRIDARANTQINDTCVSGSSGTILQTVAEINDTRYLAKAFVTIGGTEIFVDSESHTFFGDDITTQLGLLGIFLMTIMFGFLFLFSIPLAVVIIPIPTLLGAMSGLIQLDVGIAIGLEIAAIVLAVFINDRG